MEYHSLKDEEIIEIYFSSLERFKDVRFKELCTKIGQKDEEKYGFPRADIKVTGGSLVPHNLWNQNGNQSNSANINFEILKNIIVFDEYMKYLKSKSNC